MKFKSLRYFIQKTKVRLLYREYMKIIFEVTDLSARTEFISQVKREFTAQQHVVDESRIEYLIATGRKQLPVVRHMIDMTK